MREIIFLLTILILNASTMAQEKSSQVLFLMNKEQTRATTAAVNYFEKNYQFEASRLMAVDDGDNIVFDFGINSKSESQRGGGSKLVQLTYSKKLSKIIDVRETRER